MLAVRNTETGKDWLYLRIRAGGFAEGSPPKAKALGILKKRDVLTTRLGRFAHQFWWIAGRAYAKQFQPAISNADAKRINVWQACTDSVPAKLPKSSTTNRGLRPTHQRIPALLPQGLHNTKCSWILLQAVAEKGATISGLGLTLTKLQIR